MFERTREGVLQIKSFEDACKCLNISPRIPTFVLKDKQLCAWYKLRTIIQALNENYQFSLTSGTIYYPYVRIMTSEGLRRFKDSSEEVIKRFSYNGTIYTLVGGHANYGTYAGFASFDSSYGVGDSHAYIGFLGSRSRAIAQYVSRNFATLLWDAHYAHHLGFTLTDNL